MASIVSEQELFFNSFEPKLSNRFILLLDGVPSFMVNKCARPHITQTDKQLEHINVVRHVKGRSTWGPIAFTLYDPIVPSGAQAIMEWVRLHHESVTGRDGYADFYKKDLVLNVLGPVGDVVEEWVLKGCFITSADFGALDWGQDNVMEFNVTVQPDYCVLSF